MNREAFNWSQSQLPFRIEAQEFPQDFDGEGSATLDLSAYAISPGLVSYVSKSPYVKWLRIGGATAADLEWISELRGLAGLSLVGSDLRGSNLKLLNRLEALEWLQLSGCDLEGAQSDLGAMPALQSVKYNSRSVTDDFVQGLRACHRLRSLSLASSSVSDASIKELASSHPDLKTLSVFNVSGITNRSIGDFRKLSKLRFLAVGVTELFASPPFIDTEAAVRAEANLARLEAAIPLCEIDSGN